MSSNPPAFRLRGLIAATFTPMHPDGSLKLELVPPMVDRMIADGVAGFYVCGSTGEGMSLTDDERRAVAEAFVKATAGRVPVVVQIGSNSIPAAAALAAHAAEVGADAISATPPMYFKPGSVETLIDCIAPIAAAAEGLPFYYYHIPRLTGVAVDMGRFLELGAARVPTLAGIKYSDFDLSVYRHCLGLDGGRFDLPFGSDEMLLAALAMGGDGAVGTCYAFAAPLWVRLIDAWNAGDLEKARNLQSLAILLVRTLMAQPGGFGASVKEGLLPLLGFEAGALRPPQPQLPPGGRDSVKRALGEIGFWEWGR
ncbi:MAG: dihydrodipicolinate synthase family protein [Akkermansiaceae bacterium]|nr:dihydrodipicolinate synthase family protein [Akkermansiaceae bacterium]MCP5550920.1 dihydrodipicolinate synthase family protein [Akkermansiaceae bacterium]